MQRIVSLVLFVCSIAAWPAASYAQTPSPAAAAPAPKKVTGSAIAGVSYESGRTDMLGASLVLTVDMRRSARTTFGVEFDATHASTKLADTGSRLTLNDSQVLHLKFEHDAARRLVLISQTTGTRDKVRRIRHRVEEFAGAGLSLGKPGIRQLRLIPLAAFTFQDKNVELEANFQAGAGVMQDLTVKFNEMWSLDQHLLFRRYFENEDDFAINATAAVTAKITSRLGLQLAFVHSHENLVAPGTIKWYQKVQGGLSYIF